VQNYIVLLDQNNNNFRPNATEIRVHLNTKKTQLTILIWLVMVFGIHGMVSAVLLVYKCYHSTRLYTTCTLPLTNWSSLKIDLTATTYKLLTNTSNHFWLSNVGVFWKTYPRTATKIMGKLQRLNYCFFIFLVLNTCMCAIIYVVSLCFVLIFCCYKFLLVELQLYDSVIVLEVRRNSN